MNFIFCGIIGGSPSNSRKGDSKDCSSRRDEPYLIFKSSELCMVQFPVFGVSSVEKIVFVHHIGLFYYCKRMFPQDCPDLCFVHKQSQNFAGNSWVVLQTMDPG